MEVGGKIITGILATAMVAVVGHFAMAEDYVTALETQAQTELNAQGMEEVTVKLSRSPLTRSAVLDGELSDIRKQTALITVSSIAGISGARWAGDKQAETAGPEEDAPNPEEGGPKPEEGAPKPDESGSQQVAGSAGTGSAKAPSGGGDCQRKVNAAMNGRKLSFRSGSAYVSPASNQILDDVSAALSTCANVTVAVGGHTDDKGDPGINKIMSQERADRVRAGLVERGFDANRITATGYGSERPLAAANASNADAQNRRIEFNIQAAGKAGSGNADASDGKTGTGAGAQQGE